MDSLRLFFSSLILLSFSFGVAMKPYRPELMIFTSPDKKMELHSPAFQTPFLINKAKNPHDKIQWRDRLNVQYVFSDPTQARLFTLGGLGDPGTSLGEVVFYKFDGTAQTVNLGQSIPKLEELSRGYRHATNFPWVSAVDITETQLLIWVCDKVLATISFKDLHVDITSPAQKPVWAKDLGPEVLTARAKKLQWALTEKDSE
jgi:hypothetical protein